MAGAFVKLTRLTCDVAGCDQVTPLMRVLDLEEARARAQLHHSWARVRVRCATGWQQQLLDLCDVHADFTPDGTERMPDPVSVARALTRPQLDVLEVCRRNGGSVPTGWDRPHGRVLNSLRKKHWITTDTEHPRLTPAGRAVIDARQPHTLFEELPRHLRRFGNAV